MASAQNKKLLRKRFVIMLLVTLGLSILLGFYFTNRNLSQPQKITNYEECVAAGGGLILTYRGICTHPQYPEIEFEEPLGYRIDSFEECVAAGNAVLESYPEQCIHDGQTFVRELSDEEKKQF
jgi:hypothetical protein